MGEAGSPGRLAEGTPVHRSCFPWLRLYSGGTQGIEAHSQGALILDHCSRDDSQTKTQQALRQNPAVLDKLRVRIASPELSFSSLYPCISKEVPFWLCPLGWSDMAHTI